MKFSASQIQFLMTKMTISDIDAFNAEASQFVPHKSRMGQMPDEMLSYEELLSLDNDALNLKSKYFLVVECDDPEQWEVVQRMFPDGKIEHNEDEGLYVDCKKARVPKPVAPEDLCEAFKKDGKACSFKKKVNGLCGRHLPKLVPLPSALGLAC